MGAHDGYLDYSGRDDRLSGGTRRVGIDTPAGEFSVWTKRVGNNPDLKVLLLHGGPGATHEYLEACDSYLPAAGVEYFYYDQLGSGFSDHADDPSLWKRIASSARSTRSAGRSAWDVTTSSSTAIRRAGSWSSRTPCPTRRSCWGW